MDIQKRLKELGIEQAEKLDNETIRAVAYNVTETLTKAFPVLYDEYNNILAKLLNCSMYKAEITKKISKVNYIYENKSIYFDKSVNLEKMNEEIIHECIHYIQNSSKTDRKGLCSFEEFSISGLGFNEAAIQYISAKSVGNSQTILIKFGMKLKTISANYYPFLTNLIQQIIYLIGEEKLVLGTLNVNNDFEDYFLNIFEGNTKKIMNKFDKILNLNNVLNENKNLRLAEHYQETLITIYMETQKILFNTFFNKMCSEVTTIEEVEQYYKQAINYKKFVGVNIDKNKECFYDDNIKNLTVKFNKKLIEINKELGKNNPAIVKADLLGKWMNKLIDFFSKKKV